MKGFLSKNIDQQLNGMFDHGQCCFKPTGEAWKNLLDTISDLLAYQLQEVSPIKCLTSLGTCAPDISHWSAVDSSLNLASAVISGCRLVHLITYTGQPWAQA